MVNERLRSLQKKVHEFNALTNGRAGIIWKYKGETLTFGDQQLFESLQYKVIHQQFQPGIFRNSTSSPNPTSSTSSHRDARTPPAKRSFKDKEAVELALVQYEPRPAAGNKMVPKITAQLKKEDLDLLAVDFLEIAEDGVGVDCDGTVYDIFGV